MKSLNRIKGYLTVRITGYSPERFLNMCNHHGIRIWNLHNVDAAYVFQMYAEDFKDLGKIARKTHMRVRIEEKVGLPFFFFRFRKRKLFFPGLICGILLIFFMSMHIWNIDITGNVHRSDETLLSYLHKIGVYDGMWKKDVHCTEIAASLREYFNDLTWVSVSMDGTCLSVKVKETSDTGVEVSNEQEVVKYMDSGTDLIADESGTVVSIITRCGTPVVHENDKVKKGDILVSGCISLKNDAGEITGYHYVRADADVILRSEETYREKVSLSYKRRQYTGKTQKVYYVNLFGYSFYLGAKASSYRHCDQITMEKQLRLSDSFYLPIYYGTKIWREYGFVKDRYTEEEAKNILSGHFQEYCRKLDEKGVEITGNSVKILVDQNEAVISGKLILYRKADGRQPSRKQPVPALFEEEEQ